MDAQSGRWVISSEAEWIETWLDSFSSSLRQMETPVSAIKMTSWVPQATVELAATGCGLARFPFWVARRGGRTAADVLLSDCPYRKALLCMADAEFRIHF